MTEEYRDNPRRFLDAPIATLHTGRLGEMMLKVPLVAMQLGHRSVEALTTYLHSGTPEAEFVQDFIDLRRSDRGINVEQFIDKWYGGREAANDLIQAMFEIDEERQEAA